jgi:hypothetical protein
MVALEIKLPEAMLIFVETQATARGLTGPSEYLQSLIAAAQAAQDQVELEQRFAAAVRAMEQGEPNPLSLNDWHELQERALNRLPKAGGPPGERRV